MSRGCERRLSIPPVENFRVFCETQEFGRAPKAQLRQANLEPLSLVRARSTRGTELSRMSLSDGVSLVDHTSFSAVRVSFPSRGLRSGVSAAPRVLLPKSPPVARSAGDKVATAAFLLIPERLSLAKDVFFFPPTIAEVSVSNDFHLSAKWPLIGSNWGADD